MFILAHRGYWTNKDEHNTLVAFKRAFSLGFGVETDIRDQGGELVVSHDMPSGNCLPLKELLALHQVEAAERYLAINLKSTELSDPIHRLFSDFRVKNYFLFDSAVPDNLKLSRRGLPIFTRHSDIEPIPALYEQSEGVWMDEMLAPWIDEESINQHLENRKKICLVSPELHGRENSAMWQICRKFVRRKADQFLMVCTDFPQELQEFVNG